MGDERTEYEEQDGVEAVTPDHDHQAHDHQAHDDVLATTDLFAVDGAVSKGGNPSTTGSAVLPWGALSAMPFRGRTSPGRQTTAPRQPPRTVTSCSASHSTWRNCRTDAATSR